MLESGRSDENAFMSYMIDIDLFLLLAHPSNVLYQVQHKYSARKI